MVKSKELKIMRKKLEKAEKIHDPLRRIDEENCRLDDTAFALSYKSSTDLDDSKLQQCLALFESNMADFYRSSSWGLDLKDKKEEFQDKKARFLLITSKATAGEDEQLAAFAHFRFCYDDDDEPENVVIYVYEIQVCRSFRRQGLGRRLMAIIEAIGKAADLPKVMLTVFRKNTAALQFYQTKLDYIIDESSPSKHGEVEDYEIVSKAIT